MWTWLRAHAADLYGTYWYQRGLREYEFVYGQAPFVDIGDTKSFMLKFAEAIEKYFKQSSTHWGQGKANPATIAWLLRQAELELKRGAKK